MKQTIVFSIIGGVLALFLNSCAPTGVGSPASSGSFPSSIEEDEEEDDDG